MPRKKKREIGWQKAVLGTAGIQQAIYIWKKLNVGQYHFEDPQALTLKELSIETWDGCTPDEFDKNPGCYKMMAKKVLKKMHELDDRCRIVLIRDFIGPPKHKISVTKICRSDRTHAVHKVHHLSHIAAGCMVHAMDMNARMKLGIDIGKDFTGQIIQRLPDNYTKEDKTKLATQLSLETAREVGTLIGRQQAAGAFLSILDERPDLKAKDGEVQDEYAKEADARRKRRKKSTTHH